MIIYRYFWILIAGPSPFLYGETNFRFVLAPDLFWDDDFLFSDCIGEMSRYHHYGKSRLSRVPKAHGEAVQPHVECFAYSGWWQTADGSHCQGKGQVYRVPFSVHMANNFIVCFFRRTAKKKWAIATGHKPVATRTDLVATRTDPVATGREPLQLDTIQLQLEQSQ